MVANGEPAGAKLLTDVIIQLNIARKNVLSYPKGHPLINTTIDKAFELLEKLLTIKNEIIIGVAKDALLVGEEYLDVKSTVFKDFALALNKKAIASVTFIQPIKKEEFIKFHDIISAEQEKDAEFEDIIRETNKTEMENIKLKVLDYKAFRIIEEKRHDTQKKADKLWDSFIRAFLENLLDLIDDDEGEDLSESIMTSPASLAEMLNQKDIAEISQALCDTTVSSFLNKMGNSEEERKISLGRLTELISNLKPELREQFLASVIQHVTEKPDSADDILPEFPEILLNDVIEIISDKEKKVPATVLTLLQKLIDTVQEDEDASGWAKIERDTLGDLTENEIKNILTSSSKESSTPRDYSDILTKLASSAKPSETGVADKEMQKAVDKLNIEEKMVNIIFELLHSTPSGEEFSKLTGKLGEMSIFFLEIGQFHMLTKIYNVLAGYIKSNNETFSKTSSEAIQFFSEQSFMDEVINSFTLWGEEKHEEIAILIKKIGSRFLPHLLDALSSEKDPQKKNIFVQIITTFGSASTSEAIKRVEDTDPYFIRRLITILRQSNNRNLIPAIQRFLKHSDTKVQIEALRALLHLKAPDISELVSVKISSKDHYTSNSAISLAGVYKVKNAKDLMLNIIRKNLFWGTNIKKREACAKSLGEIGDPAVLPELGKICKARGLLNRKALKRLKVSIVHSITGYPPEKAVEFLEAQSGSDGSKDNEIQKACAETLDKIMNRKKNLNG